jgi:ribosomal protein L40E
MIVCRNCGNSAASKDGFCLSCGALLEWSGEEMPGGVAARPPTVEGTRPRPVPVVTEPAYTGPYCMKCGVRNPEGRVYCRACGQPLQPEPVATAPRPGWWRRLWRRLRGRKDFAAGDRPGNFRRHDAVPRPPRKRGFRMPRAALSRFAPLLLVAGLLGVGLGPARVWLTSHLFGLEQTAQAKLSEHYVSVVPVGAVASSSAAGHGAALAIDGVSNTYWATAASGVGATLTVKFGNAAHVDRIGVLSGEPGAAFRTDARPHTLEVSAPGGQPVDLSFDDSPNFQNQSVNFAGATELTIVVKDVYPGQQAQAVALSEIQFFSRT